MTGVPRETSTIVEGLGVSRETLDRLAIFAELLDRWNRRINLISPADIEMVWQRHILDSLQLVALIASATHRGIDLGSGAGFPGLVLAIALNMPFDLIESDRRKAVFLAEAARETRAPVTIHVARIERCCLSPAMVITSRALAPLPRLLTLASPLLAPGGYCLFHKGQNAALELQALAPSWTAKVERYTSLVDPHGVVLRISEVARA